MTPALLSMGFWRQKTGIVFLMIFGLLEAKDWHCFLDDLWASVSEFRNPVYKCKWCVHAHGVVVISLGIKQFSVDFQYRCLKLGTLYICEGCAYTFVLSAMEHFMVKAGDHCQGELNVTLLISGN